MVDQATQAGFTRRIDPCTTPAKAPCSIGMAAASGRSRWTKDELRAVGELGIVAGVGAMAGWFTSLGVVAGAIASIAAFWLALAPACLLEFFFGEKATCRRRPLDGKQPCSGANHGSAPGGLAQRNPPSNPPSRAA